MPPAFKVTIKKWNDTTLEYDTSELPPSFVVSVDMDLP